MLTETEEAEKTPKVRCTWRNRDGHLGGLSLRTDPPLVIMSHPGATWSHLTLIHLPDSRVDW
jgi:hypothetical protein